MAKRSKNGGSNGHPLTTGEDPRAQIRMDQVRARMVDWESQGVCCHHRWRDTCAQSVESSATAEGKSSE